MTVIILLFSWLGVHRYLVVTYNANPWKMGGMAMYTNTHRLQLDVEFYRAGQTISYNEMVITPKLRERTNTFYRKKSVGGDMVDHTTLAYALLYDTQSDSIQFKMRTTRMDPVTNRLFTVEEGSVYKPQFP